jgi:hypothetical protein
VQVECTCNSSSPGCLVSNFLKKILPSNVPDPCHFGTDPESRPVKLDYESGSGSRSFSGTGPGSCSFLPWLSRSQPIFLIFCLSMEGAVQIMMDSNPDPGGPKSFGSYGSGSRSGTLLACFARPLELFLVFLMGN